MKRQNQIRKIFVRDFCKGFFITLAVLIPVYLAVYTVRLNSYTKTEIVPNVVPGGAEPSENIPVAQNYNLLVVAENEDNQPQEVLLLGFDAENGMIKAASFPVNTVLLLNQTPYTIEEIERQLGAMAIKQALTETFLIDVGGYVSLDFDSFLYALDFFGRFDFNATETIEYTSANGTTEYSLPKGLNSISANDVINILKYNRYQDIERLMLSEQLASSFFMSISSDSFAQTAVRIYEKRCNYFSSDISAVGMDIMAKSIEQAAFSGVFKTVRIPGNFIEGRYELGESSIEQMGENFG